MHKFVRNLITEWRKLGLPFAGDPIVVAVSGGADSMSLLFAINDLVKRRKLTQRMIVAHFNHKLRGRESDADEAFVRKCVDALGMEFAAGKTTVRRQGNLEQNARDERYAFLSKIASETESTAVLTAHTRNDQAETLLMNLIRGSGPEGLSGMRAVRDLDVGVLLVRPLLSWATRADTEGYASEHDLGYRIDRMNSDETFTRVRIRKTIIPMLAEINPRIVETLAQTADLLQHRERKPGTNSHEPGATVDAGKLKELPRSELYAELRAWLRSNRGSLRSLHLKHIEAIERLLSSWKSGKTVELPGGGRVVKEGGRLVFSNIKVEK